MKKLLLALLLSLAPTLAFAACNGVFPSGTICGVPSASPAGVPGPLPLSSFEIGPGGSTGQVQTNNGSGGFNGITSTQLTALLNVFSSTLAGAVPLSGGGTVNFLRADGTWHPIGVTNTAGFGISNTGTCNNTGGTCTQAVSLSNLYDQLTADVDMNNTSNYFTGPTVATPPAGTYLITTTISVISTTNDRINCKLWDGVSAIFASGAANTGGSSEAIIITLTGIAQGTYTNFTMSCQDQTSTSGIIKFNLSGNSTDSNISAVRIQ